MTLIKCEWQTGGQRGGGGGGLVEEQNSTRNLHEDVGLKKLVDGSPRDKVTDSECDCGLINVSDVALLITE